MAVKSGIPIFEFWEMTIGEIVLCLDSHIENENDKTKEMLLSNYNLAASIASFMNLSLNGNELPSISSLYPEFFEDKSDTKPNEREQLRVAMLKEQLLDFSLGRNKQTQGRNTQ